MATRKDYVALEEALAAAAEALHTKLADAPDTDAYDMLIYATVTYPMIIATTLSKVNKAFDIQMFIDKINELTEKLINEKLQSLANGGDRDNTSITESPDVSS